MAETVTGDEQWSMLLSDQVCFALYAASRSLTSLYRPVLDALGLTYPQYLVLLVLWERGSVPVRVLGAALHLDYGTLTPLLKRLEAHGIVRRERSASDERSVLITLTEQGAALQAKARSVPALAGNATAMEKAELDQLLGLLRKLTTNVTAAADAYDAKSHADRS
jgi:DNA-binding MarR family transcriptional regulator